MLWAIDVDTICQHATPSEGETEKTIINHYHRGSNWFFEQAEP